MTDETRNESAVVADANKTDATGAAKVTAKAIEKRLKYIAQETRRAVFERKRSQLAHDVLSYIASGEAKSPRNLARAFVDSYPDQPAAKTESTGGDQA